MLDINWRDAANYDYTDYHDDLLWGWEFLRRNPKYQANWRKVVDKSKSKKTTELISPEDIASNEQETKKESNYLRKTWGLKHFYYNPTCEDLSIICLSENYPKFIFGKKHRLNKMLPTCLELEKTLVNVYNFDSLEDDEFAVVLDITKPISPQLDGIKPILFQLQKLARIKSKKITHHRLKWKNYLRVLDANAQQIDKRIAASIIFPKLAEVRNPSEKETATPRWNETLYQATVMVESGFRKLLSEYSYD